MWQLFSLARTWKCRPSELMDVEHPFDAYCLDNAVATFGNALTYELESVEAKTNDEAKNKRERIFNKWLGLTESNGATGFSDPAKRVME